MEKLARRRANCTGQIALFLEVVMPRKHRIIRPDSWHHVMNRAVARRTMFESDWDVRRFIDRLEVASERGTLQIHAYAVLQTHFHLLVRCPEGRLSAGMHLIEAPFGQWFNRTRGRDGPIHRSRFHSIEVDSLRYRHYLVRYIDSNPLDAGLAGRPDEYPHCSARHYASSGGPPWLCRDWVESEVILRSPGGRYEPRHYSDAFPPIASDEQKAFLDGMPQNGECIAREVDRLFASSLDGWERWIEERAIHADGVARLDRLVPLSTVSRWVAATHFEPDQDLRTSSKQTTRNCLHAILARTLAGATISELATELLVSRPTALDIWRRAGRRHATDPAFAELVTRSSRSIAIDFWEGL